MAGAVAATLADLREGVGERGSTLLPREAVLRLPEPLPILARRSSTPHWEHGRDLVRRGASSSDDDSSDDGMIHFRTKKQEAAHDQRTADRRAKRLEEKRKKAEQEAAMKQLSLSDKESSPEASPRADNRQSSSGTRQSEATSRRGFGGRESAGYQSPYISKQPYRHQA